jgi:hypothetical protein
VSPRPPACVIVDSEHRLLTAPWCRPPGIASSTGPIALRLTRYRDQNGQEWADIIDFLTMYPDARRRVVRMLSEIEASTS